MRMIELDHFFYGKLFNHGISISDFNIVACSKGLSQELCQDIFHYLWGIHSSTIILGDYQTGWSISEYNSDYFVFTLLQPGHMRERGYIYPHYHCWIISKFDIKTVLKCNLTQLNQLVEQPPKVYEEANVNFHLPQHVFDFRLNDHEDEINLIQNFIESLDSQSQYSLDEGMVNEKYIQYITKITSYLLGGFHCKNLSLFIVIDTKESQINSVELIQILLLFLPPSLRYLITFDTEAFSGLGNNSKIKFLDSKTYNQLERSPGFILRSPWHKSEFKWLNEEIHPYALYLEYYWDKGIDRFYEAIQQINKTVENVSFNYSHSSRLLFDISVLELCSKEDTKNLIGLFYILMALTNANWLTPDQKNTLKEILMHKINIDQFGIFDELKDRKKDLQESDSKVIILYLIEAYVQLFMEEVIKEGISEETFSVSPINVRRVERLRILPAVLGKIFRLPGGKKANLNKRAGELCKLIFEFLVLFNDTNFTTNVTLIFMPLAKFLPSVSAWTMLYSLSLPEPKKQPWFKDVYYQNAFLSPDKKFWLSEQYFTVNPEALIIIRGLIECLSIKKCKFEENILLPVLKEDEVFDEKDRITRWVTRYEIIFANVLNFHHIEVSPEIEFLSNRFAILILQTSQSQSAWSIIRNLIFTNIFFDLESGYKRYIPEFEEKLILSDFENKHLLKICEQVDELLYFVFLFSKHAQYYKALNLFEEWFQKNELKKRKDVNYINAFFKNQFDYSHINNDNLPEFINIIEQTALPDEIKQSLLDMLHNKI